MRRRGRGIPRLNPSEAGSHLTSMRTFYVVMVVVLIIALGALEVVASRTPSGASSGAAQGGQDFGAE